MWKGIDGNGWIIEFAEKEAVLRGTVLDNGKFGEVTGKYGYVKSSTADAIILYAPRVGQDGGPVLGEVTATNDGRIVVSTVFPKLEKMLFERSEKKR